MSTLVNVVFSANAPGIGSMDHFIPAYSGKSLFQLCMERNALFADRQLVIGHNEFYILAKSNLKSIGNRTYLSIIEEDHLTNLYSTAFAAFSAGTEELLLVTPSHYMVSDTASYKEAIEKLIQYAEQEMIGVLSFLPDQEIEHMPFLECEEDRIIAIEKIKDSKQAKLFAKSKRHLVHSGIFCCKAGVYLKELKALQPDLFKAAQNTWKTRVGQYVAAEARTKIPYVSIEDVMLTVSDKVKVVVQATSRLQAPAKTNNGKQTTDDENPYPVNITNNSGMQMMGIAL